MEQYLLTLHGRFRRLKEPLTASKGVQKLTNQFVSDPSSTAIPLSSFDCDRLCTFAN